MWPVCPAYSRSTVRKRSSVSTRELKGFRELTVQPVIDRAVILGEWGASDATRDEGSIGGVPATGGLIGLPYRWVCQAGPLDSVVHQNFKPEDTGDARMAQGLIQGGNAQIGRQKS